MGIEGGAVSLTNLNGSYSQTQNTPPRSTRIRLNPSVPVLLMSQAGNTTSVWRVPDQYNPTMLLSYTLTVKAGDRASVDFGAQSKTITVSEPVDTQEEQPILPPGNFWISPVGSEEPDWDIMPTAPVSPRASSRAVR